MLLKVGLNWRVLKKSLKKKMRKKKKKMRREKMGRTWLVLEKNLSRKMLKMKYTCDWVMQTLRSQHLPWSVSCWCWWWWGTYGRCTCCRVERGRLRTDSWDEKKKGMSKLCTRRFFRSLTCRWPEVKVTKATKRRRNMSLLKTAFDATCSLTDPLTKKMASVVVYSSQRCVPCVHQPSLSTNPGHRQQRNDDCARSLKLWRQNVRTPLEGPLSNIRPNNAFLLLPGHNNQHTSVRRPAKLGVWKATNISAFYEIWEKNWCSKT